MKDPVISDLARYLTEQDRRDAYQDKIYSLAVEVEETRTDDAVAEIYEHSDLEKHFMAALKVIASCRTRLSTQQAADDLAAIIHEAAMRLAKREYDSEMEAAAEALAVDRWERVCNRIREVA